MNNIFKQLQAIQEKARQLRFELAEKIVEASAGGDMVVVKMNGNKEIISIKIAREVVNPDDIEMLTDLLTAAISEAYRKAHEISMEEFAKLTGGFLLPGISELL